MMYALDQVAQLGNPIILLAQFNQREPLLCFYCTGTKGSMRLPDGTLFVDESDFDAVSGMVHAHWYWSGARGTGEKRAEWRCYTPTQIVEMLQCADLRFIGAYKGLSKAPYKAEGQEAGGMLAVIAMRDE